MYTIGTYNLERAEARAALADEAGFAFCDGCYDYVDADHTHDTPATTRATVETVDADERPF